MSDEKNMDEPSSKDIPIPSSSSMAGVPAKSVGDFIVAKESSTKLESWIDQISDFCSSILVKETRQAIKSRQFFLTFMLLIVVVSFWTFFALSPGRDNYSTDSLGSFLLCGFLWILGLPLVLIIPYTTFRSLAQEYEDGTIDMVLITTMKPHQIIAGKLGSAMLQVLIYLSVIAPCIAFCYLLRGVDISQIYYAIGGGLVISFGLCCLAIALASSADSSRVVQVLSVFLILGLLFVAWMWCFFAYIICFEPVPSGQKDMINLMLAGPCLAIISTAVILFFAASAKIAFPSSNRSTMIRIGITIQVVLFVGWLLSAMTIFGFEKYVFMFSSVVAMQYLLLVGAMMIACHSGLSPRVRRSLPTTKLTRSLFSLYMPGPGRAFLFTLGLAIAVSLSLATLVIGNNFFDRAFDINIGRSSFSRSSLSPIEVEFSLMTILANFMFFMFFFCGVYLISRLLTWRAKTRKPFVIEMGLIAAVLVFIATLGSYGIAPVIFNDFTGNFEITQSFNWYRIQYFAVDKSGGAVIPHLFLIGIMTLPMLYFCLRSAIPELAIQQAATPQRILEEEEELKRESLWGKDAEEETIDEIFAAVRPGQ